MRNGRQNKTSRLTKLMGEAGKYCKEFIPTLFQKKGDPERAKPSPERTAAMAEMAAVW